VPKDPSHLKSEERGHHTREEGTGLSLQRRGYAVLVVEEKEIPREKFVAPAERKVGEEKPMGVEDWEDGGNPWAAEEWTRFNEP